MQHLERDTQDSYFSREDARTVNGNKQFDSFLNRLSYIPVCPRTGEFKQHNVEGKCFFAAIKLMLYVNVHQTLPRYVQFSRQDTPKEPLFGSKINLT